MKFSTITTTAALIGLAAVEAKTRGQTTDRDAHDTRRLSDSKKSGKGSGCNSECEGITFYEYIDVRATLTPTPSGHITFPQALKAAPEGCVLTPVTSVGELLEIELAIPSTVEGAWVGITKSAEEAEEDEGKPPAEQTANWFNLDGSEVPTDGIWASDEPSGPIETKAYFASNRNGLADVGSTGISLTDGAVYKCCVEESDFCFGQGMVM